MNNDQRGGIISKLFLIPAGVALMVGFFFLGYYVGKYQSKTAASGETPIPLPDMVSKNLPKPEEFTFYKTLSGNDNKTVSIDLRPKRVAPDAKSDKKQGTLDALKENADQAASNSRIKEMKAEKNSSVAESSKPAAGKQRPPVRERAEESPQKEVPSKFHYTVQVASYPEKQPADEEVKKMKSRGYAAFVISSEVPNKGTWYRVRLGSFTNKAAAEKLAKDLQAKVGIPTMVTME